MLHLRISSESDVTRSLIEASRTAQELGFDSRESHAISTAVSWLATNVLRYSGIGEVRIDKVSSAGRVAIEITVSDLGPGITDLDAALRADTGRREASDTGLPAVRQVMDDFEVDTTPGKGTRVVIRKWRDVEKTA